MGFIGTTELVIIVAAAFAMLLPTLYKKYVRAYYTARKEIQQIKNEELTVEKQQ